MQRLFAISAAALFLSSEFQMKWQQNQTKHSELMGVESDHDSARLSVQLRVVRLVVRRVPQPVGPRQPLDHLKRKY